MTLSEVDKRIAGSVELVCTDAIRHTWNAVLTVYDGSLY